MDYADPKKKKNFVGKILMAAILTALCILMLKQSPDFNPPTSVSPSSFSLLIIYTLVLGLVSIRHMIKCIVYPF